MLIKGVACITLQVCAGLTGVKITFGRDKGNYISCRLTPIGEKFRAINSRNGHKKNAVCWHGHEAFFREVFKANPNAVIKTSWYGNHTYHNVGELNEACRVAESQNFGSTMYPAYLQDMCHCSQREE